MAGDLLVNLMAGRFRERQYQLAAQRHNQEYLKYDYYQQIARYFERECRNARQYDSWNSRGSDPKGELEKAKKAERLLARRNRLRQLLKEEDETYRRELEEQKRLKRRVETPSLELLKARLKEKRAEESLYLPKTCRRYQSYFVCPKEPIVGSRSSTLGNTNLQYPRVCRDSTNLIRPNERYPRYRNPVMSKENNRHAKEQENFENHQIPRSSSFSRYLDEPSRPSSRYSARYARRSLENTNVRNDDYYTYNSRMSSVDSLDASPNDRYNLSNDEALQRKENEDENKHEEKTSTVGPHAEEAVTHNERDQMDKFDAKDDLVVDDVKTTDNRQFEVEKTMPWLRMIPSDKNLSKQMFLYLTHKELKCKIEDLSVRESHACKKQCWDEALRLRDMRNRLELLREKQLYNVDDLDIDEETKKLALLNIDKREKELATRENACTDSTMYSDDAKALWKKWVHEDERSSIGDPRLQRESLMNSLEKEWQGLAIRDKERISQSYQTVMNDSALQEEQKLAVALNAARLKSNSSN